ncbi:MAG: hypothetical protein ACI4GX_11350 [Ruminococcus sp.]
MNEIINWCNNNTGFLTGILSLIGLIISTIAVIVSIRTARLPYKKKLKLSSSIDMEFSKNIVTGEVSSGIRGVSVNVVNCGSRNVNITYLGIAIKNKNVEPTMQKLTKIRDTITGTGLISPAEVKTEEFKKKDLLYSLSNMCDREAELFICAKDTEGNEYLEKLGTVGKMIDNLLK